MPFDFVNLTSASSTDRSLRGTDVGSPRKRTYCSLAPHTHKHTYTIKFLLKANLSFVWKLFTYSGFVSFFSPGNQKTMVSSGSVASVPFKIFSHRHTNTNENTSTHHNGCAINKNLLLKNLLAAHFVSNIREATASRVNVLKGN